jgi:hypothetical protein
MYKLRDKHFISFAQIWLSSMSDTENTLYIQKGHNNWTTHRITEKVHSDLSCQIKGGPQKRPSWGRKTRRDGNRPPWEVGWRRWRVARPSKVAKLQAWRKGGTLLQPQRGDWGEGWGSASGRVGWGGPLGQMRRCVTWDAAEVPPRC